LEDEARSAASAEGSENREPSGCEAEVPRETPWSRPVIRRFGLERTLTVASTTSTY
jgi:hypothetical protein